MIWELVLFNAAQDTWNVTAIPPDGDPFTLNDHPLSRDEAATLLTENLFPHE